MPGRFARERVGRLLVPLVVGIFVLSPPQVYLERVTHRQLAGPFLRFIPHDFDSLYLGIGKPGTFAWMGLHPWYLLLLFLFSLVLLPLFVAARRETSQPGLIRVGRQLEQPGVLLLPAVPLMRPRSTATEAPRCSSDWLHVEGWCRRSTSCTSPSSS